jgi:hypothetical protein
LLLAASIVALLIGPLLFQFARLGSRVLSFLEGFTFITIAGLLLFGILPQAISLGGTVAWLFLIIGMIFPVALERAFHHLAREVHTLILFVGVTGLAVHAGLDGVALALPELGGDSQAWQHAGADHAGDDLALAVVLHRFPMGLAVWYLLAPAVGVAVASGVLIVLAASTIVGYSAGADFGLAMQGASLAWFQAFVTGSILHVIVYEPGHHDHGISEPVTRLKKWPDRMGLIFGLALLYLYL